MESEGYQLIVISEDTLDTYDLPMQISGRLWIYCDQLKTSKLIELWGKQQQWYALKNEHYQFPDGFSEQQALHTPMLWLLKSDTTTWMLLFQRRTASLYQRFCLHPKQSYTIGRNTSCTICISDPLVSLTHVQLSYQNASWVMQDEQSKNGCYVNGKRQSRISLSYGDCIQLLQYRLFIGRDYLLLPKRSNVNCELPAYQPCFDQPTKHSMNRIFKAVYPTISLASLVLEIEQPPVSSDPQELPLFISIGPSFTMGLSSLLIGGFSVWNALQQQQPISAVLPTLLMSCSMALSIMVWPLLSKRVEYKKREQRRGSLETQYLQYIKRCDQRIQSFLMQERAFFLERYETTKQAAALLKKAPWHLHHRLAHEPAFLQLVIGIGEAASELLLHTAKEPFLHHEDLCWTHYHRLVQTAYVQKDVPIVLDMKKKTRIGIYGEWQTCAAFLMDKLLQISLLHEPTQYTLCIIAPEALVRSYGICYLPQLFYGSVRLLIVEEADGKQLNQKLHEVLNTTTQVLIIASFAKRLEKRLDMEVFLSSDQVYYLQMAERIQELRSQCNAIIQVGSIGIYDQINFQPEVITRNRLRAYLFQYYHFDAALQQDGFPKQLTFLDLYQCGNVEQLQILARWKLRMNRSLEVAIGLDEHQNQICLDAHELYHGPHGLVAGMTGSGKSEWLLTYLLSLAVCFSPDDVSFILIDYKGGGMAQAFQHLPHVAGMITNLEQDSMKRCVLGIQQELVRRQQLFLKAQVQTQRTVMHIDQYQQLVSEGLLSKEMGHLFIVADEFAELKQQQPAFMDDLKRIARIGRSLGIHLVLATQKPSGIIDEQIWSNARFHVCLKVQDTMDSMDMLKKEDAVHINDTGIFYLQVGHDEWYGKGICAWANAPYEAKPAYEPYRNQQISILSMNASVLYEQGEQDKKHQVNTQLEAVVESILQAARQIDSQPSYLWLPALEDKLPLQELIQLYQQNEMIGLLDDLEHQQRIPLLMKQGHWYACIMERENDILCLLRVLLSLQDHYTTVVLLSNHKLPNDISSAVDAIIAADEQEKLESFLYQVQYRQDALVIVYPMDAFQTMDILSSMACHPKLTLWLIDRICRLPALVKQKAGQVLCFFIKDMESYHYLYQGSLPHPVSTAGRGFLQMEQRFLSFQLAEVQEIRARASTWCIPVLPQTIPYQSKAGFLFLGLQETSKEELWLPISKDNTLLIISAHDFYPPFYHAMLKQQEEQGLTGMWLLSIAQYKQQLLMDASQFRKALILWNGPGLEEHLYLLKLPFTVQPLLRETQGMLWDQEVWQCIRLVEVKENGGSCSDRGLPADPTAVN